MSHVLVQKYSKVSLVLVLEYIQHNILYFILFTIFFCVLYISFGVWSIILHRRAHFIYIIFFAFFWHIGTYMQIECNKIVVVAFDSIIITTHSECFHLFKFVWCSFFLLSLLFTLRTTEKKTKSIPMICIYLWYNNYIFF